MKRLPALLLLVLASCSAPASSRLTLHDPFEDRATDPEAERSLERHLSTPRLGTVDLGTIEVIYTREEPAFPRFPRTDYGLYANPIP